MNMNNLVVIRLSKGITGDKGSRAYRVLVDNVTPPPRTTGLST